MNSFLYIEDLVANALIENIIRNGSRQISFDNLEQYATCVVQWWEENKNLHVTALTSKYDTDKMMFEHADFFEMIVDGDIHGTIGLKKGKTSDDLRKEFRSYLSIDMLTAFIQAFDRFMDVIKD